VIENIYLCTTKRSTNKHCTYLDSDNLFWHLFNVIYKWAVQKPIDSSPFFFRFRFITSLWRENIKVSVAKEPKSLVNFNTAKFHDLYWPTKEFPNFSEATSPKSIWPHATTLLWKLNILKKIVRYPPSHSFRLLKNVLSSAFKVFKPISVT